MNAAQLGEHAKLIRGVTFKPADKCDPEDEGAVVCMRTKNVQVSLDDSDLIAIPSGLVKNSEKMISTGDILVSSANSWNLVGKCCPVRELQYPSAAGGFISILRPTTESLDSDYLYRWFSSVAIQRRVRSFANQTTNISNLDHKRTLNLQIPLPPLEEQKRIAGILDAADILRAKRREALARLDDLLQSTFLDLFGDPVTNPKGWEKLLEDRSIGWERCTLGDQITLQRGKDITKKSAKPGKIPVISSGGVSFFHDKAFVSGPGVLLGRKGSVGKVHFSNVDYWPHDTTLFVKDFKGNLPRFVYFFFKQFPISHYEASAANPSLNRNNLHPVKVLWPPLDLQQRFATIVESVEEQKAKMRKHLKQLDDLFASLQQRAFRGDL
jgi:type I restriction enzyme, S subunit